MMAPTEILARQHYENAARILEPLGVRCRLLTGSTKASEKKRILRELESGEADAVFGTHALISKNVKYRDLQLAITDEQHRFGVQQRCDLEDKGAGEGTHPHVLVMSATPIPRSLALILYGDLDISVIDELPRGGFPYGQESFRKTSATRCTGLSGKRPRRGNRPTSSAPWWKRTRKKRIPS